MFQSLTDFNVATQCKLYFIQPEPILEYLIECGATLAARSVYFFHFNLAYRKGEDGTQIYNSTISRALGISERCVSSAHNALEKLGLIRRERMPRPKGCFKEPAAKTMLLCPAPLKKLIHESRTRSTAVDAAQHERAHEGNEQGNADELYRGKIDDSVSSDDSNSADAPGKGFYRGKASQPDPDINAGEAGELSANRKEGGEVSDGDDVKDHGFYRGKMQVDPPNDADKSPNLYRGKTKPNHAERTTQNPESSSAAQAPSPDNLDLSEALEGVMESDPVIRSLIELRQVSALYGRLQSLLPQFDTSRLMAKLGFPPSSSGKSAQNRRQQPQSMKAIAGTLAGASVAPDIDQRLFHKVQASGCLPDQEAMEVTRQVSFSVERGALSDHERNHAINICMKLLRERRWREPMGYQFFLCYGYAPKAQAEDSASSTMNRSQAAG